MIYSNCYGKMEAQTCLGKKHVYTGNHWCGHKLSQAIINKTFFLFAAPQTTVSVMLIVFIVHCCCTRSMWSYKAGLISDFQSKQMGVVLCVIVPGALFLKAVEGVIKAVIVYPSSIYCWTGTTGDAWRVWFWQLIAKMYVDSYLLVVVTQWLPQMWALIWEQAWKNSAGTAGAIPSSLVFSFCLNPVFFGSCRLSLGYTNISVIPFVVLDSTGCSVG